MVEKNDALGLYVGEIKDNYPHGHGKKFYIDDAVYNGEWAFGRKHGVGILESKGKRYHLKFKNGVPKKLLKSEGLFSSESTEEMLFIPYNNKQEGDYFVEVYGKSKNSEDFIYFAYYIPQLKCLGFKGKIFSKRLKDIQTIQMDNQCLIGESSALNGSQGFAEFTFDSIIYIGYLNNFLPNGKGKIFQQKNDLLSEDNLISYNKHCGNFTSGKFNGKFVFKNDVMTFKTFTKDGTFVMK